jgi:hypothetical protein
MPDTGVREQTRRGGREPHVECVSPSGQASEAKVKAKAFVGASVLAAVAASMCWFLPIVFVTMGVGVVGAAAFFAACRPVLLGISLALLGLGFYFSFFNRFAFVTGIGSGG